MITVYSSHCETVKDLGVLSNVTHNLDCHIDAVEQADSFLWCFASGGLPVHSFSLPFQDGSTTHSEVCYRGLEAILCSSYYQAERDSEKFCEAYWNRGGVSVPGYPCQRYNEVA
ncbi:hypothetical protein J6590_070540 [Homalodisca vitripennis]|nr:hypothetical protein J6590_070540 [Homalodisca vitripennis]